MVDKRNLTSAENDAVCCCASGPIFLVGQNGEKVVPIPTWNEEWATWKAETLRVMHTARRFFLSWQRSAKNDGETHAYEESGVGRCSPANRQG